MSTDMTASASAPCSFTLFGYNYRDYAGRGINIALDSRITCRTEKAASFMVNQSGFDGTRHPYIRASLIHGWSDIDTPVSFHIDELKVPDNVAGYYGAYIVSALGSLSMMNDHLIFEDIARKGFEVLKSNRSLLGPLDISGSINGSGIMASGKVEEGVLWSFDNGQQVTHIHDLEVPEMDFVLAFLGEYKAHHSISIKVENFISRQRGFTKDIFKDASKLADKGLMAIRDRDLKKIGKLMNKTDKLTTILGAYSDELKELADLCRKHSFGARLCVTGEQGFIAALTDRPEELRNMVEEHGGIAALAKTSVKGLRV